jgi:hypothetical protein
MKVYFRSGFLNTNIPKIYPKIQHLNKINKLEYLYEYSIPLRLRKNICKVINIPTFEVNTDIVKLPKYTCFISNKIDVYKTDDFIYIQIPFECYNSLYNLIHFLRKNHNLPCFINGEFTRQDIPVIENIMKEFTNLYFKFSDLEFHYFKVDGIDNDTLKITTHCLTENMNFDLPYEEIKNKFYTVKESEKEYIDVGLKKYYTIIDKNLGLLSEYMFLPKSINIDDVIILQ